MARRPPIRERAGSDMEWGSKEKWSREHIA
jgi:hypothetical protein